MRPFLNIVFPVRNEESRLEVGIQRTITFLEQHKIDDYVLTIVDNDSTDETAEIATALIGAYPTVRYIRIPEKGVGVAFRTAVKENESPIVGYMDIDLATDLEHIPEMLALFDEDDKLMFVNGSRWAQGYGTTGRGMKRTLASMGLTAVLKRGLGMRASDAVCGFKFFRKDAADSLVAAVGDETNDWFYIIEMLLAAEQSGLKMCELPVRWIDDGRSSVDTIPVIKDYLHQISKYRRKMKGERKSIRRM